MAQMSFRDAVRKRPGMYIGDVQDGSGANSVIYELAANTVDQFLAGTATRCELRVDGYEITVQDDGAGLPFGERSEDASASKAEFYLEQPHFGATADGHAPHVHFITHGVGLAAVNALCSHMAVTSWDGRYEWFRSYECGLPKGQLKRTESTTSSGTRIELCLDKGIFAQPPDLSALTSTLAEYAPLFPDLELVFNGAAFRADRGLLSLAESLCKGAIQPAIWHRKAYADFQIDLALVGKGSGPVVWRSWLNGVLTREGGSHQRALERALAKLEWNPAVALVHVIMRRPEFAGPCRDEFHAPLLEPSLERALLGAIKRSP